MFRPKQALNANELAGSLIKELSIQLLLAKRPAFPLTFVEKTIAAGLDVNAVDRKLDETLLMYAARTGNLKLAQLVVEKGAVVDQTNVISRQQQGENAFILACKHGYFDLVDFLLSKGSKVSATDRNGASAMHLVVKEGNHDSICRLVERGLGTNLRDILGKTPLHYAAEAGDLSTLVRLIQLGADINAVDHSGRTPAAYAEDNNHYQVLDQLIALGGKNSRNQVGTRGEASIRLADLSIGALSPHFKDFLTAADRTVLNVYQTREMLEERPVERLV
jgi:ankyrin repeat protein